MTNYKRFKDPIYGYIDIPIDYVKNIIDKSEFQRLRRISQTSYSALYSSSVHNRFIHSIGVFYLGGIASSYLCAFLSENSSTQKLNNWGRIKEIFDLACLLHDVGHAPFSHTGEKFFLNKNNKTELDTTELHNQLKEVVGDANFNNDIPSANPAAPHEIISAIIGIERFATYFANAEEKSFFARCITGYKFSDDYDLHGIYNCFISLLNSKVIDVDKLDYLIRDAYFTGYQSTDIDYQRLLTSLIIIENEVKINNQVRKVYSLGYRKHALSIIENVVFAHDAERKWIQTHPIVLYETYIIQHILDMLDKKISCCGKKLFSVKTLSKDGESFEGIGKLSLLCDDDIVYLLKSSLCDNLSTEYFERTQRRHPLWKSEAEYKASFTSKYGSEGALIKKFNDTLDAIEKFIRKNTDTWVINDDLINKIKKDKETAEELLENKELSEVEQESLKTQIFDRKKILPILECLQNYSEEKGIKCDFVILNADIFNSGFNKDDFGKIPIEFDGKYSLFKDVVSTLSSIESSNRNFFYIFYKDSGAIDKNVLRDEMVATMIKITD